MTCLESSASGAEVVVYPLEGQSEFIQELLCTLLAVAFTRQTPGLREVQLLGQILDVGPEPEAPDGSEPVSLPLVKEHLDLFTETPQGGAQGFLS